MRDSQRSAPGQVALLLGRLRQQQPRLRERARGRRRRVVVIVFGRGDGGPRRGDRRGIEGHRGAALDEAHVGLERGRRVFRTMQLDVERTQGQPRRRQGRIAERQRSRLLCRIGEPLRRGQRAHVEQLDGRARRRRRDACGDDRFGGRHRRQQVEREQRRPVGLRVGGAGALREVERLGGVAGREPAAADRDPGRGSCLGIVGERFHRSLDERGDGVAVGAAAEKARHRVDHRRQRRARRLLQQGRERLVGFGDAIERDQQLHLIAQGFLRLRQGLAPCHHGAERLVAGARLQGDVGDATKEGLVLGALGRVEQQLVGRGRVAAAQLDLTQQQLIEERRVEVGADNRGLARRGHGGRCRACRSGEQRQRQCERESRDTAGSEAKRKRRHRQLLRRKTILVWRFGVAAVRTTRKTPAQGSDRDAS